MALASKSSIFIRTQRGQEHVISCNNTVWIDWYPFNLDCLLSIDPHGRISCHTIKDATISSRSFMSLSIPAFVRVVDAAFGAKDTLNTCDLLSNLSLFILCDNADVVLLAPIIIAPLRLPVSLLADLSSNEQQQQLDDIHALP